MELNSQTEFIGHYSNNEIYDVISKNLMDCDSFRFSVSFIMESGLKLLLPLIECALNRGSSGTIVTTDYMRITTSGVLSSLLALMNKYKNLKCYFLETKKTEYESFHTKGYVFTKGNIASVIIGSSNMSATALSKDGGEWSLFSTTYKNLNLYKEVDHEFQQNIKEIGTILTQEQIDRYSQLSLDISYGSVDPNFMQIEALRALNDIRVKENKKRALVVAAMGSGKTFLSAFDAKNQGANHILYICHSETILKKARIDFEKVFVQSSLY